VGPRRHGVFNLPDRSCRANLAGVARPPLFCGALAADAAGGTSFRMLGLVPLGRSPQPDSISTKSRDDPNLREGIADPFLRAWRTSPIYKSMAWVFPSPYPSPLGSAQPVWKMARRTDSGPGKLRRRGRTTCYAPWKACGTSRLVFGSCRSRLKLVIGVRVAVAAGISRRTSCSAAALRSAVGKAWGCKTLGELPLPLVAT
jgi:hypothetical protein